MKCNRTITWGRSGVRLPSRSNQLLATCLLWLAASAAYCQAPVAAIDDRPGAAKTAGADRVTDPAADLVRRHPPGAIDSVATADAALADVSRERALVEAEHARDEQACAPAFFMTRCLDSAKERRRAALARLRPIEIEANAFKRRDRVVERDRLLEEKRLKAEEEATPEQRALKVRKPERPDAGTTVVEGAGPDATALKAAKPAPSNVRKPHVAKPSTPSIDAATQARNMASFDRKAAESLQRQKEVAAKKAENERDRAKKQAEHNAKQQAEAEAARAPK